MLLLLTSIGALQQEGGGASYIAADVIERGMCSGEGHLFGCSWPVVDVREGGGANILRSTFLGTAVHLALVSAADSMYRPNIAVNTTNH